MAKTLTEINIDFSKMVTRGDLQAGIEAADDIKLFQLTMLKIHHAKKKMTTFSGKNIMF